MSAFTYTAKLALIAGHTVDTVYSFDLAIKKYDQSDVIDAKQQTTAQFAETIFNSAVSSHKFTTIPLTNAQYLQVREFLLSASNGQEITFDPSGTVATPVNPITGKLKLQKNLKAGQPAHQMFDYSFEILELL